MLRLDYGDAEDRVCRAIAAVAVAMHDFEEEAFAPQGGDADIIPLPYAESDSDASVLAKKAKRSVRAAALRLQQRAHHRGLDIVDPVLGQGTQLRPGAK